VLDVVRGSEAWGTGYCRGAFTVGGRSVAVPGGLRDLIGFGSARPDLDFVVLAKSLTV
jgi:hypothetical protein